MDGQASSRTPQKSREKMVKAQEIMTRRVFTVRRDSKLQDAIAAMLDHGVSGLPVVDEDGAPVGMLSEGDLLRRAELGTGRTRPRWLSFLLGPGKLADEYTHTHGRLVADVMSDELHAVAPDTPIQEVVLQMERHHVKRLPVLQDGRLVGIISRANLLRALALAASGLPAASKSDDEIRERLVQELASTEWAPRSLLDIAVRDGEVHLYGTILDEREREALCVAARNMPGVKAVHDHLVWCEPTSGAVLGLPEEPDQPGQPRR
ncbi:CBS domain-containing protein [Noviherbaspirillum suwonense]|jgi:CBS domain-containing protein|uniref:CBS domain-containing protein n=2 Tax=Noviherbaspirillum suwonense TaxID=1224511 RepID=A0ABY1Q4S0_9BURK|nr:CBS domain-containing protein [Noviherbaspirillum suwonense]